MAEYIEREALFHRTKAVAANVIFRGCEEMVSPKDSCNPREWTKGYEHGMKESLNLIATQGAADVAPVVHGRWVGLEYDGYADGCPVYDVWECSECGEEVSGEDVPETHPYCHGCGARMDGE